MASSIKEVSKLNHIDILRGLAVTMVVFTHVALTDLNISGSTKFNFIFCQTGVQLFFVLSAYTLCRSMHARRDSHTLRDFYIRRFFRIAPLYYIGILLYWLVANILTSTLKGPLSHIEAYTPVNIISNILFLNSFNYAGYNNIVPGGWSIGTEMLFYLVFPYIFMLYERVKRRYLYFLFPVLSLLIATIYTIAGASVFKEEMYTNHFFYAFILNQLPVFMVGVSFYFIERHYAANLHAAISLTAFMILFATSFILYRKLNHNINLYIFVSAISFVFLFLALKKINIRLPILSRIGQLSFSIYIFHFLFAYPLAHKVSLTLSGRVHNGILLAINFFLSLLLSAIVAMISEKIIEKPGVELGRLLIKKLNTDRALLTKKQAY
jgi:peptidoglycan/LPS O-acetylase OafA/YrhL